ncbi:VIR protein [Plasmodium vivax]|uniref:VIR protein n=1 Tax=Plasmodium vivax TaxID=5855 RepID=A0A1G4GWY4_PLAVI|nr:VIR protein [Plasmodium vivax]
MTTSPEKKLEEAAKAVELHKIHPENFFSKLGKYSTFDILCNGIDDKVSSKRKEVKDLCINLVRHLDKLSESSNSERNNYCSYVRYWLYEQIGELYTSKTTSIDDILFFKELIDAWTIIYNGKLEKTCNPEKIKGVKLNELKNRIRSYIYFKNLEKIKKVSTSENKTDCEKYLTYLESFKSLHDKYKIDQCEFFSLSSSGTDYFPCKDKNELTSLISKLGKCKNGDKPDPKTVLPNAVGGKGVSGQAPVGGQKGSEGTTGPKASVVVASSSSSSTTVTTSPAVTTPKAVTVSSPVATTSTVAATKPGTTTTNTVTTTSTRSSPSQERPSLWASLFSSPSPRRTSALTASQTSTSTSGSTVSARPVATVSAPTVRGSAVTQTTNTPNAAGSLSSTGQLSRGGLVRPQDAAAVPVKSLSLQPQGNPGYALNQVSSNNLNIGGDANLATITDVPGSSETLYDKLDSNTVKNIIMAAAVLGIIFFLFYYNRSSRIESSIKPKKRKKKAFEHNFVQTIYKEE